MSDYHSNYPHAFGYLRTSVNLYLDGVITRERLRENLTEAEKYSQVTDRFVGLDGAK